jgi:peptidoglycan hydrolase-like protein with peptidoglycan-binding domain
MMRRNVLRWLLRGTLRWHRSGLGLISLVAIGLWTMPAMAQRADYTPSQFISVLNGLGYPVAVSDPIDAPNVSQAIRDFQLQFNLPVTGTITATSQDRAAELVKLLQQSLNRSLKPSTLLPVSQYYGTQTETLVKVFQERNRLPVTGIATLETRRRLGEELQPAVGATPALQTTQPLIAPNGSSIIPPLPSTPPALGAPQTPPLMSGPSILPPIKAQPTPVTPVTPAVRPVANVKFGTLYTEPEMRRILQGIGYDIDPKRFLSDASAIVAIQDFQARYGLSLTGAADQPTQEMARKILRGLQYNLGLALDRRLPLNEFYDDTTESAVREFQKRSQMRVDGLATMSVRRAIDVAAKQRSR